MARVPDASGYDRGSSPRRIRFAGSMAMTLLTVPGLAAIWAACGGDAGTPTTQEPNSTTFQATTAISPEPTIAPTAEPTLAPTLPPTEGSTLEPAPTPEDWSDQSIAEKMDRAWGYTFDFATTLYPDSAEFKSAHEKADTALEAYNTALETEDFDNIQAPIEAFANVGKFVRDFACKDQYGGYQGNGYLDYRVLVETLSSRYEHEGSLAPGTTERLIQSMAIPADCVNETILAASSR